MKVANSVTCQNFRRTVRIGINSSKASLSLRVISVVTSNWLTGISRQLIHGDTSASDPLSVKWAFWYKRRKP
ncbi:hypothetical protein J6590_003691 [Homalodisca vitripennis]|nr:hypothetical protein J6590_003691 [Homalodisca vitripennis]